MRIKFYPSIQKKIFMRVDGKCSYPGCKIPAMGPGNKEIGAINMGVACHIYSAAEKGPRGQGIKDPAFISSEQNGIWCCVKHASLIDKDNGSEYSAETLFKWKSLAEARAKKLLTDTPSPLGWIDSIEFSFLRDSPQHPM